MVEEVCHKGRIEELLGVHPERVCRALALCCGVPDEAFNEAQESRLVLDIGDGVEVHGAREVHSVERLDLVSQPFEDPSHIVDQRSFGIRYEEARVGLHEVGFHVVARLSGAGPSDDEDVVVRLRPLVVSGVLQALARGCREDDVVVGVPLIGEGHHLAGRGPAGATMLLALAVASAPFPPSHPYEPYGARARRTDAQGEGFKIEHPSLR